MKGQDPMRIYGIVGKPLAHSFSPGHFSQKFRKLKIDADYRLFELDNIEELPDLIERTTDLCGLSITIPYKRSVYRYMDEVDKIVQTTGSINTIKIERQNGKPYLSGFNTDVIGFEKTVEKLFSKKGNTRALILGTGGSAHSVAYVLRRLGIFYSYVSRVPAKVEHLCYDWLSEEMLSDHKIIINTTPVGMYPEMNACPGIPFDYIKNDHILYDLIYNPQETEFLRRGRERGATTMNGLPMLGIQADQAWKIWNR